MGGKMMIIENKNRFLPFDLQFFADGGEGGTDPEGGQGGEPEKVELTSEELQKKIEAESDRKLAKALEKKQKEWESKQQEAIQAALEEKERLSKLSEKERKEEELSQREKDIATRLAELERKELKADAIADLNEKGLPAEFADILLGENAEKTLENINNFKTAFDEAVNAAVKEKLRQETPPAGGGISKGQAPSVAKLAEDARLIK